VTVGFPFDDEPTHSKDELAGWRRPVFQGLRLFSPTAPEGRYDPLFQERLRYSGRAQLKLNTFLIEQIGNDFKKISCLGITLRS
jgi:hypothetical protein